MKNYLLPLKHLSKVTEGLAARSSLQLKTREKLLQKSCEDQSPLLVPSELGTELESLRGTL